MDRFIYLPDKSKTGFDFIPHARLESINKYYNTIFNRMDAVYCCGKLQIHTL